uniref:NEDD8-conjugating enzyme UBC12 n=1 Tax=Ciona savignyi TaxID=51511 RepID=H2ZJI2_CIOSA
MIKLFSLKQQKKDEVAVGASSAGKSKPTAAQLRLTKGKLLLTDKFNLVACGFSRIKKAVFESVFTISILVLAMILLPKTCKTEFPDPNNLLKFKLIISPDEGYYVGGVFTFSFTVGLSYPHEAPKVKCETKVYHPNIDLEGNVCLNILREDWKPVLTINSVIYGIQYLFLEPNPEDPLNKEAAEVLSTNRRQFAQNVVRSMRGGYVGSVYFERCLK